MFDRLTHPIFITLTVPNKTGIRKHDFTLFRQRVRQFLAQYKGFIQGGVYSLETTYNRTEKTWHIHAHILADACSSLPSAAQKIDLAGLQAYAFNGIKYRMEFDWLRLWSSDWGKELPKPKKRTYRTEPKNARAAARRALQLRIDQEQRNTAVLNDTWEFESWLKLGRANALKQRNFRTGEMEPIPGLSDEEIQRRTRWNTRNRRVIDVRPVNDRDKAAREVLKYITKAADFCDVPEAVEAFANAVKSARLIQTFGTWYGAKFDTVFDPEHMDDWGEMKCTCGLNMWERMGVFYRRDVEMDASGRWHLKRPLDHKSCGTVPHPTIRALSSAESEPQPCQMERR
jgi:hypothetical protein